MSLQLRTPTTVLLLDPKYGVLSEDKEVEALPAGFGALAMIRYYANGTMKRCVRAWGAHINIPKYWREVLQRSRYWF